MLNNINQNVDAHNESMSNVIEILSRVKRSRKKTLIKKVKAFLNQWVDNYLDVRGKVEFFINLAVSLVAMIRYVDGNWDTWGNSVMITRNGNFSLQIMDDRYYCPRYKSIFNLYAEDWTDVELELDDVEFEHYIEQ